MSLNKAVSRTFFWSFLYIGVVVESMLRMKFLAPVFALILLLVSGSSAQRQVNYVQENGFPSYPDENCPDPLRCMSLEEYVDEARIYFTSGSTFIFLPGNHSLYTSLNLVGVTNISFRAAENDANIHIYCGSKFDHVSSMLIKGLRFISYTNNGNRDPSVLNFFNSRNLLISSSRFQGGGDTMDLARAIHSTNSSMIITNCTFDGNTAQNGGAIYADLGSSITLLSEILLSLQVVPFMLKKVT